MNKNIFYEHKMQTFDRKIPTFQSFFKFNEIHVNIFISIFVYFAQYMKSKIFIWLKKHNVNAIIFLNKLSEYQMKTFQ